MQKKRMKIGTRFRHGNVLNETYTMERSIPTEHFKTVEGKNSSRFTKGASVSLYVPTHPKSSSPQNGPWECLIAKAVMN